MDRASWEPPPLVDVLLQREALVALRGEGREPHDFAGLYIGEDDMRRALGSLPGLADAPAAVESIRAAVAPAVSAAREAFAAEADGDDRLAVLARAANCGVEDGEVLALLAGVELSPARQRLVCYVQDNVQPPRVTVAGLARFFAGDAGHPAERAVAPGSPLRRAALVRVEGEGPLVGRACAVPDRVLWHLAGLDALDEELPPDAHLQPAAEPSTPPDRRPELLLVHGGDPETRRLLAAGEHDRTLLVTPPASDTRGWEAVIREATLRHATVVVEADAVDALTRAALERATHLDWVVSSRREIPLESLPRTRWRELAADSGVAVDADWQRILGRASEPSHSLTREQLRLVGEVTGASAPTATEVGLAVRRLAGGHLDGLAVRVRPERTWADLVLPDDRGEQLRELIQRHRRRSRVYGDWGFPQVPSTGVVALFSGPSGTGKTLAAEVIAGELGLDLYKVDLSAVVSKYIGETEKNLERIFEAAAAVDLVLFFDEADALFGKRSEVSDAHDRYANIEVAYLLQRLESYDGLVVLATNLQGNIDSAFLRRIAVSVDFGVPDQEQRRGIWACSFPETAPTDELDFDLLAERFKVTGGVIHSAALAAAFLAAERDESINTGHVLLAMRREYGKLGRLCTEDEFGPDLSIVTGDADVAPA